MAWLSNVMPLYLPGSWMSPFPFHIGTITPLCHCAVISPVVNHTLNSLVSHLISTRLFAFINSTDSSSTTKLQPNLHITFINTFNTVFASYLFLDNLSIVFWCNVYVPYSFDVNVSIHLPFPLKSSVFANRKIYIIDTGMFHIALKKLLSLNHPE